MNTKSKNIHSYNENKEYINNSKKTKHSFEIDGSIIVLIIICSIGIYGIVSFFTICFGPCNHDWDYISYKHDYQCTKCYEWKKQLECNHEWVVTQNSANWYQRKCTKCGKFYTEKKF